MRKQIITLLLLLVTVKAFAYYPNTNLFTTISFTDTVKLETPDSKIGDLGKVYYKTTAFDRITSSKAFEIAGYTKDVVESKFPSLYEAFKYGAPPHAGMAPGIDRILMLLKDEENIREMVAFPLGANGADAMMGCPGEVFEKQLRETHIKIRD